MKKEVLNFYSGLGLQLPKLIKLRGKATKEQVEAAMEKVYYELMSGELDIKPIMIGRHILSIAVSVDDSKVIEDHQLIETAKVKLAKAHKERDKALGVVKKKNDAFKAALGREKAKNQGRMEELRNRITRLYGRDKQNLIEEIDKLYNKNMIYQLVVSGLAFLLINSLIYCLILESLR